MKEYIIFSYMDFGYLCFISRNLCRVFRHFEKKQNNLKFYPKYIVNYIQGSGIVFYESYLHSAPVEKAWKEDSDPCQILINAKKRLARF